MGAASAGRPRELRAKYSTIAKPPVTHHNAGDIVTIDFADVRYVYRFIDHTVAECASCYALVSEHSLGKHADWHQEMVEIVRHRIAERLRDIEGDLSHG